MFKEDHLSFRQRKYMKVKNIIGSGIITRLSGNYCGDQVRRRDHSSCLFFAEKSRNP